MSGKNAFIVILTMIVTMSLLPMSVFAGGDQNTLRGSEGEQIGEPAPEPAVNPEQPRIGDPNEDMENIPAK